MREIDLKNKAKIEASEAKIFRFLASSMSQATYNSHNATDCICHNAAFH